MGDFNHTFTIGGHSSLERLRKPTLENCPCLRPGCHGGSELPGLPGCSASQLVMSSDEELEILTGSGGANLPDTALYRAANGEAS